MLCFRLSDLHACFWIIWFSKWCAMLEHHRYGPVLESVITITEELAYKQAKEADQLLAEGRYLGRTSNFNSSPYTFLTFSTSFVFIFLFLSVRRKIFNICYYRVRCLERDNIEISSWMTTDDSVLCRSSSWDSVWSKGHYCSTKLSHDMGFQIFQRSSSWCWSLGL